MATHRTARGFTPPSETAAALLATTGGSINQFVEGRVIRLSTSAVTWDMAREWSGREIVGWKVRPSLWTRCNVVSLLASVPTAPNGMLPLFTVELPSTLTPEETEQSASTYMMLLNIRRKES